MTWARSNAVGWRQKTSTLLGRAVEYTFLASGATAFTITAAAIELFFAGQRCTADLTNFTQFMIEESHASGSVSGAKVGIQYSLDGGSTWTWLDGTASASAPTAYVDVTTALVFNTSGWFTIAPAARTTCVLRSVGVDGTTISYNFRVVRALVR